jgi:hypothetical protein
VKAIDAKGETTMDKAGWKTSEFWVTLLGIGVTAFAEPLMNAAQVEGPKTAAWTGAVLAGIYTLSRSYVKGKPAPEPKE